jgi:uncharacterized membrane protein
VAPLLGLLRFGFNTMQPENVVIYSLAEAPLHILVHLAVAVAALVIGAVVLLRRKGTRSHVWLGRTWAALMIASALTSFLIQGRGRFSLIHVLSVVVLISIPMAVHFARTKRIRLHRVTMIATYCSLCITGLFTLLPYRMLGQLLFR